MFGSGGSGFGGFGQQNQQNQQPQQGAQPGQGGGLFGAPQQTQQQQPAATGGFGGFGAQPSTFGGGNTGGSLFGQPAQQQQQQQQPSSGFTFGQSTNNATPTPFGQQNQPKPAGFGGFGASASTTPAQGSGFGGFGASQSNQTQPAASPFGGGGSTFGAKPAGSLFGQQQPTTFGQPAQSGGLFGSGGGLGASQPAPMPTQGTSNPPYDLKPQPEGPPDTPYDQDKKIPQLLNYTSITCMKPYRVASLEELRLQDYEQGRKSGNGGVGGFGQPASTGGFGAPSQPAGLFGQQQQQQQQQPQSSGGFGGGGMFGQSAQQQQPPGQSTGGLFGGAANPGGGLFGQQQQPQTGGGLFGQTQNNPQQPASGGFGFGASQQQQSNPSSGFGFGQNNAQQQNKPTGGLFGSGGGGFGATSQAGGTSSGFQFGGANNQAQQPATGGFGGTSGGFGFGASSAGTANQPKPGGLFGAPATSSAPSFGGFGAASSGAGAADNKPAASFSFGGGAFGSSAPGQTSTAAPTGGLFGSAQPTTTSQPTNSFSFGGNNNANPAGAGGGGLFGGQQTQQNPAGGFGSTTGGLFGNKPATGGLFGAPQQQQQQQQPATGSFGFGGPNNSAGNTGGGLFGNTQNKPGGGMFGGLGTNNNPQQQQQTGGLFGNSQSNNNGLGGGAGGGLFGSSQPGQGGMFGSNNNQQGGNQAMGGGLFGSSTSGFGVGGQNPGQQSMGGSLFGNSQQSQQPANLQPSLNNNPYGTDALFGGQATSAAGAGGLGASSNNALQSQPHLPFNVSLSRSSAKKQPPLVPPFRPSSRNSIRITKLRGSTPGSGFRESTPGREGTPGPGPNSLFSSSPASSYQRLTSPSPSIFKGLSDEMPRSSRESSVPTSLPPQAFVSRPSVKRLVLDDNNRTSTTGLGRSNSLFTHRGSSTAREDSPAVAFERNGTPAQSHVNFNPALESAASSRVSNTAFLNDADSTLDSTSFTSRRAVEETPSKGSAGADMSLPALNKSAVGKQTKEDALLPLDYWTSPALSELRDWSHAQLQAVEGFVVGRRGYGSVSFDASVDLTTIGELSNVPGGIVILRAKECIVYPNEEECVDEETGKEKDGVRAGFEMRKVPGGKASQGSGLNVPAIVKLEKCWPYDRSTRLPIKDEEHIRFKQLINKLKRRSDAHFISFEVSTGTWSFRVDHFSRYGLDETDEEATDEEGRNRGDGKGHAQQTRRGESEEDDEQMAPPPARALDESTDEGESEAESDLRASQLALSPPRMQSQSTPRQTLFSTSARGTTPVSGAGSATPSGVPWAASLGLEARRVQVMQASFFGGEAAGDVPPASVTTAPGKGAGAKMGRLASPSFGSSGSGAIASRSSFLDPPTPSVAERQAAKATAGPDPLPIKAFGPAMTANPSLRPRKFTRLELQSSVVDGGDGIAIDAGLAMGRSFRVGWGPDGTFVHSGKLMTPASATGDQSIDTFSTVKVAKLQIFAKEEEAKERARLEHLLDIQLKHSIVEDDEEGESGCPAVYPSPSLRFHHFATALEGAKESRYETAIFKLGAALFDEVDLTLEADVSSDFLYQVYKLRRRNNVANWIRWYVGDSIQSEVRGHLASTGKNAGEQSVFSYLSGGFFEQACKQAIDSGDVRLASLIAQASGGDEEEEFRLDLIDQLSVWRSSGVDALISPEYRRIFELLSGNVTWSRGNGKREEGEAVKDLSIVNGLDWVRTFSLFLHYDSRFDAGLEEVLDRYESSIGGEANVVPPLPPYLEKEIRPGSQRFRQAIRSGRYERDVLFHLLKLFCDPSYELENALDPLASSGNRLDYSTVFHSAQLLSAVMSNGEGEAGGLSGRDFSDRVELGVDNRDAIREENWKGNSGKSDRLCVDFAMQLESMGLWKWAAFVLLHLELRSSRKSSVQALLARKVDQLSFEPDSSDVAFLVDTLHIPVQWLYQAKADRACSQVDPFHQYQCLLLAHNHWQAHDIAIRFLAPEGIIRHDFDFVLSLFEPFQRSRALHGGGGGGGSVSSSGSGEEDVVATQDVAGWSRGGKVYLDYIAMCRSLPRMISNYGRSGHQHAFSRLGDPMGEQGGATSVKIIELAGKIPKLMQEIRDLFQAFQQTISILVAQTQMITSLYTCIRLLKSSPLTKTLALDVNVEEEEGGAGAKGGVPVEVENLQFFANDYCSMLIAAA